ncbi:MAG: hypothetical protein AAFW83_04275 [Pseudomonadota bacterium]
MRKLSLLAAASALVLGTAANAGQLQIKLKNVNGNGNTAADDATDTATGVTTIDRPGFIIRTTTTPNPIHPDLEPVVTTGKIKSTGAAVAAERTFTERHPFNAHMEVNFTRIDTDDPNSGLVEFLPDEFLAQIFINGGVLKERVNGEDFFRNGMMGEGNLDFDVIADESGDQTGEIGDTNIFVSVINRANGRQTDFGLVLPILSTGGDDNPLSPCEPIQIQAQLFNTVGFGGPAALGSPDIATLLTCEPSFGFQINEGQAKVDFETDFKSFLTYDDHQSRQAITIGSFDVSIWNNLFDPKADPNSDDRTVGSEDIESHEITFQFEDLTGIESAQLVDAAEGGAVIAEGVLDRTANTVSFSTGYDFVADDPIVTDIDHDGSDESTDVEENVTAWLQITAFAPGTPKFEKVDIVDDKGDVIGQEKRPTGAGAIDHQAVSISANTLNLVEPCKDLTTNLTQGTVTDSSTPKFICDLPLPTGDFSELTLTGQNFGPFDWVGQGNALTRNFFRVTHLPLVDGHGEPITSLKGVMTLKNTTGGGGAAGALFDDTYKFDLPFDPNVPNAGANGVYMITPGIITNILVAAGAPGAAFGTSDISFTFFVNNGGGSAIASTSDVNVANFKIDVDRLMINSDGSMVPYGDNANDSNSDHAVSGDDGRFGPKTPLKFLDK